MKFAALPPELHVNIFKSTLPPEFTSLDSSLSQGPRSTWSRIQQTKNSIVLVCRAWYESGVAILYEDVHLRRFSQLVDFLRTLKASEPLGELVRSIEISCLVPENLVPQFDPLVQDIFKLCPLLTSLGASDPGEIFIRLRKECFYLPAIPTLPSTVTHLYLEEIRSYSDLFQLLNSSSDTLLSLRLSFDAFCDWFPPKGRAVHPLLNLTRLQSLYVKVLPPRLTQPNREVIASWRMPLLKHLSIFRNDDVELFNVITSHGENLLYLHAKFYDVTVMAKALASCPRLERFVTDPDMDIDFETNPTFFHSQLKWIDILHPLPSQHCHSKAPNWAVHTHTPALRGVRHIWNFPSYMVPKIELFDPTWVQEEKDRFTIQIFDCQFRHEVGHLCWNFALEELTSLFLPSRPIDGGAGYNFWDVESGSEWEESDSGSDSDSFSEVSGGSVVDLLAGDLDRESLLIETDDSYVEYVASLL